MAPVRNLRGIGNPKPIPVNHAIPPIFAPSYKIELVNSTSIHDISDLIEVGNIKNGVTDNIGNFYFKIVDPYLELSNIYNNFDYVKVYLDYGATATTLRFKGVIERSPREDIYFKVYGRSIAMTVMGKNIIYIASDIKRSSVLIEVLNANFPEVDTSNIEDDTTTINVNYSEISFQDIMEEICGKHHDFYIDADLKAYYFEKGSKINSTEAVTSNQNHISTDFYGADSEETITRVRVYGNKENSIPVFSTSTASTEHTNGIVKERKINDSSALTPSQTLERAEFEYAAGKQIPHVGSVTSLLLPTLNPGEKLFMGIPLDKIDPDYYTINSFVHKFPILQTELIIQQKGLNMNNVIKNSARNIFGVSEQDNLLDLSFSIIYDYKIEPVYNNSIGDYVNTVIGDGLFNSGTFDNMERELGSTGVGILKTVSGSTGTWISEEILTDSPVSLISIKQSSTNLEGTKFFVSLDRGNIFKEIGSSSGNFTFPNPQNSIIIKVEIKSSNTRIKKIGIYYNIS